MTRTSCATVVLTLAGLALAYGLTFTSGLQVSAISSEPTAVMIPDSKLCCVQGLGGYIKLTIARMSSSPLGS